MGSEDDSNSLIKTDDLEGQSTGIDDDLVPDSGQVKEFMSTYSTILFLETALYRFHEMIFWLTLGEGATMVMLTMFFIRSPANMWFIMFHVFHVFRGLLGWKISKKLPHSHSLLKVFLPSQDQEGEETKMQFSEIESKLKVGSLQVVRAQIEGNEGRLRCYMWLTVICILGDIFDFII